MKPGEKRYSYSDEIQSIIDMKDSTDGLGIELTTSEVVSRLNQLEAELADYKKRFEPQMIQIRMQSDAVAHQEKTYRVRGQDDA